MPLRDSREGMMKPDVNADLTTTCIACCIEYARDELMSVEASPDEVHDYRSVRNALAFIDGARDQLISASDHADWLPPAICCGPQCAYLASRPA